MWMCGVKSPFCSHRFHSLMFPPSSRHENVWRSCVMIRPHCSVLLRVLYLSTCMLKFPSPLWGSVSFTLMFHVMFLSRGPQLCFSLYTTFINPWENYRRWPSAKCWARATILMCLSKSASGSTEHPGRGGGKGDDKIHIQAMTKSCYGALDLLTHLSSTSDSDRQRRVTEGKHGPAC